MDSSGYRALAGEVVGGWSWWETLASIFTGGAAAPLFAARHAREEGRLNPSSPGGASAAPDFARRVAREDAPQPERAREGEDIVTLLRRRAAESRARADALRQSRTTRVSGYDALGAGMVEDLREDALEVGRRVQPWLWVLSIAGFAMMLQRTMEGRR